MSLNTDESGFVRSKSRNLRDAMVAIRKQPSVIISGRGDSSDKILCSYAARTASGMGVASALSKGIRVWDLRKSDTVWLCKDSKTGRSSLSAIQRSALICVIIRVRDGFESFFRLRWSEAVSNVVDMLINKSRIVNLTKKFGGEPNFIEDVPEKGSGSVSI